MKLGIISDVHADLLSLIAALELLRKLGATQIVCAGDLAEKGTDGDAVVETIKNKQIPTVRGNHDKDVISNQAWLIKNYGSDPRLAGRLLMQTTLDYLAVLPPTLTLTLEGVSIVVAHGIPSNDLVYLYPTSRRGAFENAIYEAQDIDPAVKVLIVGHTHLPLIVHTLDTSVFNAGSVARLHTSGSGTCGLLTLPEIKFEVFDLVTGLRIVPPRLTWDAADRQR
jgi:putative phosphoesterase